MWNRMTKPREEKPLDNEFKKYLEQQVEGLHRTNLDLRDRLSKFTKLNSYGNDYLTAEGLREMQQDVLKKQVELSKIEGNLSGQMKEYESKVKVLESTIKTLESVINKICSCK